MPQAPTRGIDAAPDEAGARVGRVYVFGGAGDVGGAQATVLAADIHADGSLGAWATVAPLPEARIYAAVVGQGFVAVVGWSGPSSYSTSAFVAKTQAAGLGAWSYVSNAAIVDVQVASISSAAIGAFAGTGTFTTTYPLPSARTYAQATVVAGGHILVTGGENVTDDSLVYDIDTIQGSLGTPRGTLALPAPTDHHATVAFGNHVYVIGGFRNTAARLTDVVVGDVAADGTITRWTPTTSLPVALAYHTAAAF